MPEVKHFILKNHVHRTSSLDVHLFFEPIFQNLEVIISLFIDF